MPEDVGSGFEGNGVGQGDNIREAPFRHVGERLAKNLFCGGIDIADPSTRIGGYDGIGNGCQSNL